MLINSAKLTIESRAVSALTARATYGDASITRTREEELVASLVGFQKSFGFRYDPAERVDELQRLLDGTKSKSKGNRYYMALQDAKRVAEAVNGVRARWKQFEALVG